MYLILVVIVYLIVLALCACKVQEQGPINRFEKWFFSVDKYGNESNNISPASWFTLLFIGIIIVIAVA